MADLFRLVGRLRDEGLAVVMVEQFVGQALQVADRAVVLEQGSVVAGGTPDELSTDDLAAAYLGGGGEPDVVVRPAPASAAESLPVALPGRDVRRLEQWAASQGLTAREAAARLLAEQLERTP